MLKQIFKKSFSNFKANGVMSFMLCLLGILTAGVFFSLILVPLFGESLTILIVMPLVLVPILFSIQTMHFGFREKSEPNGTLFFRFFRLYFAPGFMGVYRVINSILFAFLSEMGVSLIVSLIVTYLSGNPVFAQSIEDLLNAIQAGDATLVNTIVMRNEIQMLYYISYIPGFGVGIMVAFLSSSFNSMSLYFKIKNPNINPAMSSRIYLVAKNMIRGNLIKEYWGLNWPVFVLFILGYAGGACIGYFNGFPYVYGQVIGAVIGLAATIVYMPIFVNNLEEIYLAHEQHWASAPSIFAEKMQQALTSQLNSLQDQMDELNKQKNMNPNQNNTNDENQNNDYNNDSNPYNNPNENNDNVIVDAEVKDDDDKK